MSVDLHEYQRQVMAGLQIDGGVDPLAHCALGLTGEAGEVADLVKKSQYATPQPIEPTKMIAELGDVLWYLTAIAGRHGWTLQQIASNNVAKLEARHPTRSYSWDRLHGIPA